MIFILEYQARGAAFSNNIFSFTHVQKLWKSTFFMLALNLVVLQDIKNSLGCSFGCNYLLNFNWHTMKIHNCHHANVHELEFSVETGILLQNKQFKGNVCERITANIEFWESGWKSIINNYSLLINSYYKMLLWKSHL